MTARCDRCRVPAPYQVILPSGGGLSFCGLHLDEHHAPLERAVVFPCGGRR